MSSTPRNASFEISTPASSSASGSKSHHGKPPLSKKMGKKTNSLVSGGTPVAPTPTPLKPSSSRKSSDFRTPSAGRANGESPMARYPKHLSPADVDSKTTAMADGGLTGSGRKIKRVSHDDEVPFQKKKMKTKGGLLPSGIIVDTQEPLKRPHSGQTSNIQYDLPSVPGDTKFNMNGATGNVGGPIGIMENYIEKLNKELLHDLPKKLRPPIPPYIPVGKPTQISDAVLVCIFYFL